MNKNSYEEAFGGVKRLLKNALDTPLGRPAKKILITLAGVLVVALGLLLIILPGPAIVLIPIGLAILALEYPLARRWLGQFQKLLSSVAKRADDKLASLKKRR
ncbi:MAG: PGPGW domain-containing protein [Enterobacterales bacterium]|nr:PGPGW domain-containing protein [Enterobacterales bacterium]